MTILCQMPLLFKLISTKLLWNITQLGPLPLSGTLRFGRNLVPLSTRSIMIQLFVPLFQPKQRSSEIPLKQLSNVVLLSDLLTLLFLVKPERPHQLFNCFFLYRLLLLSYEGIFLQLHQRFKIQLSLTNDILLLPSRTSTPSFLSQLAGQQVILTKVQTSVLIRQ